jgi:hypothetical protein
LARTCCLLIIFFHLFFSRAINFLVQKRDKGQEEDKQMKIGCTSAPDLGTTSLCRLDGRHWGLLPSDQINLRKTKEQVERS